MIYFELIGPDFDPFVHTPDDDMDADGQYSFEHMLEFVKLVSSLCLSHGEYLIAHSTSSYVQGIAFVTELSAVTKE